ncbi:methionyl-tRNA formyltransferase [Bacillus chungangensis]|uniref:Methionyl-tRNA formyltransferase n=1 Tax=Bacillus chungangensis TaxID=587633 RepID=A0ABT9WRE9_9BACI|nr:methionyl-tRNA formyltransferase [Bacillus chungangensis]MDQ0175873.1 methionyl-tRNA formyltransferase [Bacillus chungangensis]
MTKIVFMGTPDFSVPILRQLIKDGYDICGVVTQPDRPVGRKRVLTPPPVKQEAEKHQLPVIQPEKMNEIAIQQILALKPDLIVTAAFGQLLPKQILTAPTYGCINVHASLLPELRGGAPIHYAILQGKKQTGITIMYMVEKLDAGDMIRQVKVPIDERDDVGTLHDKLSAAGARLLSETLPAIIAGDITPLPQNEEQATFAFNIKREDEKIDWSQPGEAIYNHIRGLRPWPVAYTSFQGKVMKIWGGEKQPTNEKQAAGTIIEIVEDGFVVKTGNDIGIKVTELQPAGKKKMTAQSFLRGAGQTVQIGMMLGEEYEKTTEKNT